ncbi:expressed protein [Phakopsora pachyrhizi]|uniref:Expressed protein n=1 Tax=Phakopsora pachyrhizi TaxID=170000 RepID=A0AAV0BM43_PHAPC|nr:expressed protein [Phakopsora pachyrhizi]
MKFSSLGEIQGETYKDRISCSAIINSLHCLIYLDIQLLSIYLNSLANTMQILSSLTLVMNGFLFVAHFLKVRTCSITKRSLENSTVRTYSESSSSSCIINSLLNRPELIVKNSNFCSMRLSNLKFSKYFWQYLRMCRTNTFSTKNKRAFSVSLSMLRTLSHPELKLWAFSIELRISSKPITVFVAVIEYFTFILNDGVR